jgi:hypothetical protein
MRKQGGRVRFAVVLLGLLIGQCRDAGAPLASATPTINDERLYRLITRDHPFSTYSLFPNADSVTAGTLNGSTAHRPLVRVSMNDLALNSLSGGKLPAGAEFSDGSVIVKEIREDGATTVLAVMVRDRAHSASGQGWLWAEYTPAGNILFSISSRGSGCISCHSREQGPQNDLVRTFERQRP